MTQAMQVKYRSELVTVMNRIASAEEAEQEMPDVSSLRLRLIDAMSKNGASSFGVHWSADEVERDALLDLAAAAVRLAKHLGGNK